MLFSPSWKCSSSITPSLLLTHPALFQPPSPQKTNPPPSPPSRAISQFVTQHRICSFFHPMLDVPRWRQDSEWVEEGEGSMGGGHLAGENIQAGASVAVVVAEQRPSLNIGAISVSLTRQSHPRGRRRAEGGQGTPTHAQDQPEGHNDHPPPPHHHHLSPTDQPTSALAGVQDRRVHSERLTAARGRCPSCG